MNYDVWNQALVDHFTRRATPGSVIYLTVDDSLLMLLAAGLGVDEEEATRGFCDAVRGRVWVGPGDELSLASLQGTDPQGRPQGVAFLGLMVLAAHRMGDNEISDNNYFTQLRHLLRLSEGIGRPPGLLPAGEEEPLWRAWAHYLQREGLLPSARQGSSPPNRYLNYPLSQSLLRFSDRGKLRELFGTVPYLQQYREPDLLMAQVLARRDKMPPILKRTLQATGQRAQALMQAVADLHEEYLQSRDMDDPAQPRAARVAPTSVTCELARMPGGFRRAPEYFLVPRPRAGLQGLGDPRPSVQIGGVRQWLEPDAERPGAIAPLGPIGLQEVVQGVRLEMSDAGPLKEVVLAPRPFRILLRDTDDTGSRLYLSGRQTAPDTHFLFLGSPDLVGDMRRLRELGKIEWSGEGPLGGTGWVCLEDCMILDQDWSRLRVGSGELLNALRPKRRLTLGLSGGLHGPAGFLVGVPPELTLYGTEKLSPVRLVRVDSEEEVWKAEIPARTPTPLPGWSVERPGLYRLEAGAGEEPERRLLTLVDWGSLRRAEAAEGQAPAPAADPLARMAWAPAG